MTDWQLQRRNNRQSRVYNGPSSPQEASKQKGGSQLATAVRKKRKHIRGICTSNCILLTLLFSMPWSLANQSSLELVEIFGVDLRADIDLFGLRYSRLQGKTTLPQCPQKFTARRHFCHRASSLLVKALMLTSCLAALQFEPVELM